MLSLLVASALGVVPTLAVIGPAQALEPGGANNQDTLPATPSAIYQTNGTVYRLAYADNEVWAAGTFTSIRPPGEPQGTDEQSRQYLAAFHATGSKAGTPLAYSYTFSGGSSQAPAGAAFALAVSPDASTVYVGGNFSTVKDWKGHTYTRKDLMAVSTATGAVLSWAPTATGGPVPYVKALAVSPAGSTEGEVFAAGPFMDVDGVPAQHLAAIYGVGASQAGHVVEPFTYGNATSTSPQTGPASTDGPTFALAVSPDGTRLYVGGNQTEMDGATSDPAYDVTINGSSVPLPLHNIAELNTTTGVVNDFPANTAMMAQDYQCSSSPCTSSNSGCCWSQVKDIVPDAATNTVYISAEGTGEGIFDGDFAAHISTGSSDPTPDGTLLWMNGCLGATQAIQMVNGWLYKGSHAHNCQWLDNTPNPNGVMYLHDPDAFPQVPTAGARHLLVQDPTTGRLGPWYPNTNGNPLGPFAMTTDGTSLWVGGDFTTVNNKPQQGLTWFTPGPDTTVPQPAAPEVVNAGSGQVNVYAQAPVDPDDTDLLMSIYQDGGSSPVCGPVAVHSLFWKQPVVGCSITGLSSGSKHEFTVTAKEEYGNNTGTSKATSITVAQATASYPAAVLGDGPSFYWRLDDPKNSPVAADTSPNLQAGSYYSTGSGSLTYGQPGATGDGDTSVTFNGGYVDGGGCTEVNSPNTSPVNCDIAPQPSPSTYSLEAWFKTTSTDGGKIIGFGDVPNGGDSNNYDKQIYMTNSGQLVFGVFTGDTDVIQTPSAYNDGNWHYVVATQDPTNGMALYVDGQLVGRNPTTSNQSFDGYWRVGEDNLNGWPDQPSSFAFQGSIDDVAVYPTALTGTQVVNHWVASGRTAPTPPAAPSDPYGKAVYNDGPSFYWRLDEASGPTAADASNNNFTGTYSSTGVVYGQPGALAAKGTDASDTAVTFDGSSGEVASTESLTSPTSFSLELWFNTTTTNGGTLIGFGDQQFGASGNYDKHVYMTDTGQLVFGVYNGEADILETANSYNDGNWHYLVAVQDANNGMSLYVDGALATCTDGTNTFSCTNTVTTNQPFTGYWRVGGETVDGWPDAPSSDYLAGTIDEVAVYNYPLTSTQVGNHYSAAGY